MLFEHNIVFNGDDCLVVGSPAENIHFRDSYCYGGHGLSISPSGKKDSVADVQNVLYAAHPICGVGVTDVIFEGSKVSLR